MWAGGQAGRQTDRQATWRVSSTRLSALQPQLFWKGGLLSAGIALVPSRRRTFSPNPHLPLHQSEAWRHLSHCTPLCNCQLHLTTLSTSGRSVRLLARRFGKQYDKNGDYIRHFLPVLKVRARGWACGGCCRGWGALDVVHRLT